MRRLSDISDEEQARIDRELDAFFAFTEDVFADPSILDQIPDGADVQAVRIAEREPGRQYDVETPHTVAIVTPAGRGRRKPARQRSAPPPTPVKGHKRTMTG